MPPIDIAIQFCGLFEAELLVDLMLRFWKHPRAGDKEFVGFLVESTADVLKQSREGSKFVEGIEPEDMNFVAGMWYAEYCQVIDIHSDDKEDRTEWLASVRRSLPSCFCDPNDLIQFHDDTD